MTMGTMEANYLEMQASAKKIEESAKNYINNINDLYKVIDELSTAWEGVDNASFVNKTGEYQMNLLKLGEVVNNYALFLDKTAIELANTQNDIASSASRL